MLLCPAMILGLNNYIVLLPDFLFTSLAFAVICWTPIAIYDLFKWIRGK
jgi:hypothetical protein